MQVFYRFGSIWIPRLKNSFSCHCTHLCTGDFTFSSLLKCSLRFFERSKHIRLTRGQIWWIRHSNVISCMVWIVKQDVCGRALAYCNSIPEVFVFYSWCERSWFVSIFNKKYWLVSFRSPYNVPKLLPLHPRTEWT